MNRDVLRQIVNVLTFVITVVVNGLANGLPLNDLTTAEISDRYPVLITPANYVFAIWGLIYLGLTIFVIYQALPAQRENPRLRHMGYWFAIANIANATWIFMWHYLLLPVSLLLMIVLLVSLLMIYERLEIGRQVVQGPGRWFINLPFSVYLGWISVATIANAAALLYNLNWDGFGISTAVWTVIMLLVVGVLAALMIFRRADVAYAAVIIWALVGIASKQADTALVAGTAAIMAVVIVLLIIIKWTRDRLRNGENLPAPAV